MAPAAWGWQNATEDVAPLMCVAESVAIGEADQWSVVGERAPRGALALATSATSARKPSFQALYRGLVQLGCANIETRGIEEAFGVQWNAEEQTPVAETYLAALRTERLSAMRAWLEAIDATTAQMDGFADWEDCEEYAATTKVDALREHIAQALATEAVKTGPGAEVGSRAILRHAVSEAVVDICSRAAHDAVNRHRERLWAASTMIRWLAYTLAVARRLDDYGELLSVWQEHLSDLQQICARPPRAFEDSLAERSLSLAALRIAVEDEPALSTGRRLQMLVQFAQDPHVVMHMEGACTEACSRLQAAAKRSRESWCAGIKVRPRRCDSTHAHVLATVGSAALAPTPPHLSARQELVFWNDAVPQDSRALRVLRFVAAVQQLLKAGASPLGLMRADVLLRVVVRTQLVWRDDAAREGELDDDLRGRRGQPILAGLPQDDAEHSQRAECGEVSPCYAILHHTLCALAASVPLGGGRVMHSALVSTLTNPGMLYHAGGLGAPHNDNAVRGAVSTAMQNCVNFAWNAAALYSPRWPQLATSPNTVLKYHRYGEQFRGSAPEITCDAKGAMLIRNHIALLRRAMTLADVNTIQMLWPSAKTPQYRSKQIRKHRELLRRRSGEQL